MLRLKSIILPLLLVFFFFAGIPNVDSQNKDVIIVLDESNSMKGDKWESVRYAMQLVTALLDESDRFYIVRQNGSYVNPVSLSSKQTSIDNIQTFVQDFGVRHDPVIQHAVDLIKNDPRRKKILLFYGDGIWENDVDKIHSSCSDLVRSYNKIKPDLYFLKVEDKVPDLTLESSFEAKMRPVSLFEVIRTNPSKRNELTRNLQDISKKMAGADKGNADFTLTGSSLSIDVKFPLKKLLVIYQKGTASPLPDIQITSVNSSQNLEILQKLNMESKIMKGKYFEVREKSGSIIDAGQTVKIELNQVVKKEDVFVIPVVSANLETRFQSTYEKANPEINEYTVCEETESIDLASYLTDANGKKVNSISGVAVTATNGSSVFNFTNGTDEALGTIRLLADTTYISVEARYEGYFQQKDNILTVIKKRCKNFIDTTALDLGEVPFEEFIRNTYCVGITYSINDEIVSPGNYSLKVNGLPTGITCSIDSTGNSFRVCFQKSWWACDCIVPSGKIEGTFKAVPKNKEVVATVKHWKFEIVREAGFFKKWKNCLFLLLSLILLSTYIYGVVTKPRFHRTAKFEIYEVDKTSTYAPDNKKPRKYLRTGTISRYVIPFKPETKIIDGMKIIATPGKSTIMIAKESLSEKMSKNGEPVNPKSRKDLRVFRNNTIEIEKTPTITTVYTYNVK